MISPPTHKEKVFFLLFRHPVYVPHPFTNDPLDPIPPCTLAMSVDWDFCSTAILIELACYSNSVPILINFIFLSFCLMSGNSFPTQPRPKKRVTILLDLLKVLKTIKIIPIKYEFLPYYSISLEFKIVIHRAKFSALLSQITLLKMWHLGPLQNSWLRTLFKERKKILFLWWKFILSRSRTLKNKYANVALIIL